MTTDPEHGTSGTTLLALLPALAFAATFGVFFVDKDREARTSWEAGVGCWLYVEHPERS